MASSADNNGDDDYERVEQPGDLDELVERGVWMVEDGHADVGDLDLPEYIDSVDETEFRDRVRDELDGEAENDAQPKRTAAKATSDPLEIDWVAMWREGDSSPDSALYTTQLELLIELSNQTTVGRHNAHSLIDDAVDAGQLGEVEIGEAEQGGQAVKYIPSHGRMDR